MYKAFPAPDAGLRTEYKLRSPAIRFVRCRCGAAFPHRQQLTKTSGRRPGVAPAYRRTCGGCDIAPNQTQAGPQLRAAMEWLKTLPCVDCGGVFHPHAMTFDHLPEYPKGFDLAGSVRRYAKRMGEWVDELQKCDVVCANCHAVRTDERRS